MRFITVTTLFVFFVAVTAAPTPESKALDTPVIREDLTGVELDSRASRDASDLLRQRDQAQEALDFAEAYLNRLQGIGSPGQIAAARRSRDEAEKTLRLIMAQIGQYTEGDQNSAWRNAGMPA